jgi:RNA-binding protein
MTPLDQKQLRARAHALHPLVIISDKGLSAPVLREIDRSLLSHELIKVRMAIDDREARVSIVTEICAKLDTAAIQTIGKIAVLYRANPDKATLSSEVVKKRAPTRRQPRQPKKTFQAR